jgi:ArsR family transcriptional regulator
MDLRHTHDLLRLLGDETRIRLMAVLSEHELTVAELTELLGLAQSRVSTHLGRLREAGLVKVRKNGQGSIYSVPANLEDADAGQLWDRVRLRLEDPLIQQDRARARRLVERRERPGTWADSVAGHMERHYSPGRTWQSTVRGLLGLLDLGDVLDVASGDGALIEILAPRARSITCLDISDRVLQAARERLEPIHNVGFVRGDMHRLPFDDERFDQVLLLNALSYADDPNAVIRESARVLRRPGRLVAVTLAEHPFVEEAKLYDHIQQGFEPKALAHALVESGLDVTLCRVTHQEKRRPHFQIITAHAEKS